MLNAYLVLAPLGTPEASAATPEEAWEVHHTAFVSTAD
jgi:hypothetical protein